LEDWRYQELYEIEDRHWWFRGRRAVIWGLLRRAGVPYSPRILDAGCGTGRNLIEFGRLGEAEGVDFSEEAVSFCHRRGLRSVRRAPLERLPFKDSHFDLLLATDVIEHLDDDRGALAELRRVAAAGARLVVTVPAYDWLWSQHDVSMHHRRRYTARRLEGRLVSAGWQPVVRSYFFSSVLPAVAAVRTIHKLRERQSPRSDLALAPKLFNQLLELPTRAEARLIERGARLPFGVSVGMVCAPRFQTP
jgi:SAM-dependent methyltransferase